MLETSISVEKSSQIVGTWHIVTIILLSPTLSGVDITAKDPGSGPMQRFDIIPPSQITAPNESIESTLRYGNFGVSQNNELSAGYNVRGGNFNENLIYVNDISAASELLQALNYADDTTLSSTAFTAEDKIVNGARRIFEPIAIRQFPKRLTKIARNP